MNTKIQTILLAGLLGAAVAGAEEPQVAWSAGMVIAGDDQSTGEPVVVELSGADLGFDLHELQVGESRAVIDDAGRNVLVT